MDHCFLARSDGKDSQQPSGTPATFTPPVTEQPSWALYRSTKLCERTGERPSTNLVTLLYVHVAIGIVVHLLVNVADSLEAELLVLIVAQGLVNSAEFC